MSIDFLRFLKEWNQGKDSFTIKTSGSTGMPKEISLKRELLIYSAEQTYKELEFSKLTKIYNCISTDKIGGFMNWVRAVHYKLDIQTVKPSGDPMVHLSKDHNFTFISLVPLQLYKILEKEESKFKLNRFKTILLGGAGLNESYVQEIMEMQPVLIQSYGMTETYSHIGLKKITDIGFKPIGDLTIETGIKTTLTGTITSHIPLEVNDILSTNVDGTFSFLGRKDNVINSGGIKISPEELERKILIYNPSLESDFIICALNDKDLGSKVILLMESKQEVHLNNLENFEQPKMVYYNCTIIRNDNGKLLRKETLEAFLRSDNGE